MNREVECKDCKYYFNDPRFNYPPRKNTGTDVHTVCRCLKNIDQAYPPSDPRKYISTPSIINRNKDCNWFSRREKLNIYVWSHETKVIPTYKHHGEGTFNINPKDGVKGLYIGEKNLKTIIDDSTENISTKVAEHDQIVQGLNERVERLEEEIHGGGIDENKIVQTIENKGLSGGSSIIVQ